MGSRRGGASFPGSPEQRTPEALIGWQGMAHVGGVGLQVRPQRSQNRPKTHNRASDDGAHASGAKPRQNFKKLMHEEINLIEKIRHAHLPSRITFFLRMLEMDQGDSDGVLSEEEINRDTFTEFLDKEKAVFATGVTNISIIDALLTFAMFTILAAPNVEPSAMVSHTMSETHAKNLLFAYIALFQIATALSMCSMFTCVLWLMEIQECTPTNEDGIWCIINNNTSIPICLLFFAAVFTVCGELCMIFLMYGWVFGVILVAAAFPLMFSWSCLHIRGLP